MFAYCISVSIQLINQSFIAGWQWNNDTWRTIHVHLVVSRTEQWVAWYRQGGDTLWRTIQRMCTDSACVNDDDVWTRFTFVNTGYKVTVTFLAHKLHSMPRQHYHHPIVSVSFTGMSLMVPLVSTTKQKHAALYGLRVYDAPWFHCWFQHYINHFAYFLTTLRINPFHFQAGGRKRRPNLA